MKYEELKSLTIEKLRIAYTDDATSLWDALLNDNEDIILLKRAQKYFRSIAKSMSVTQLFEAWLESNEELIDPKEIVEVPTKSSMISDLWFDLEEVLVNMLAMEDLEKYKKSRTTRQSSGWK